MGDTGPTSAPHYDRVGFAAPPQCFVNGDESINACFVAQTKDDWVILAFRGTLPPFTGDFWAWVDDWMQDFEIGPVPWSVDGQAFGQVEGGFAAATTALHAAVSPTLKAIDWSGKKGLVITGHSKGAAAAFLAASLFKSQYPEVVTKVWAYAAPLCGDATFRDRLYGLGLLPHLVRYQNEDDLVPFLPWYPTLDLLASTERRARPERSNLVITRSRRLQQIANDYVTLGAIRYLTTTCAIEYGAQAEADAWAALEDALLTFSFGTIVDAHGLSGRYLQCPCAPSA